jgi:hypothetical protein
VRRFALLALLPLVAAAPPRVELAGVVFEDRNGNGTRDSGEPGVGGVAVSNQDQVTRSGADGSFRLPGPGYGVVFVSVPDGYRAAGAFWRRVPAAGGGVPLAFGLSRVDFRGEFSFLHASDTHISPTSVGRTRLLRQLVDSLRPAFVLITGDLIRDALRVPEAEATGYYELLEQELARFTVPVWTVPGNHELFGIERHHSLVPASHPLFGRGMYRHYRGPDYYSFSFGGVHFVGLNTIGQADLWYYGQVDSLQLAWLERDLAALAPETPVVTFNHIPFLTASESLTGFTDEGPAPTTLRVGGRTVFRHSVSNAAPVLARLKAGGRAHPLALGGHLHKAERVMYPGVPTRFELAGAVVGPSPGAGFAFPSGVTLYRVRGGQIDAGQFIPLPASP